MTAWGQPTKLGFAAYFLVTWATVPFFPEGEAIPLLMARGAVPP